MNKNLIGRKTKRVSKTLAVAGRKRADEEIRTLKQKMEFILGVTKTGLDIIDSGFSIRYIDPEWAKVYGDPTGKKCYEYFMSRSEVCLGCGIPIALKTKNIAVTEETLIKEGNRPIQVTTIPFQNSKGEWLVAEVNVDISERKRIEEALFKTQEELEIRIQERTTELMSVVEALQDEIAERKRAEKALRESENKYRELTDFLSETVFECNENGRVLFSNRQGFEAFGYTQEDFDKGLTVFEMITPEGREKAKRNLGRLLRGEKLAGTEYTALRKNGSTFPAIISSNVIIRENRPVGLRGLVIDITYRKKAEETLRESEEKYRTILENIEDSYYEADIAGNLTFFNDPACRLLGYSKDELLGMNNREYMDQENADKLYQIFNKVYRTREPTKGFDWEIIRKDGTKRYIEASISLVKNPSGQPIGSRGIVRDITERKRAEEALSTEKQRFQTLSEQAPFGLAVIHKDGTYEYINPKFKELFGYDLSDVPDGRTWFRKAYPDPTYRHRVISDWINDLESSMPGEIRSKVFTANCKDGAEKTINFIPVQLETGEQLMACEDITERKRAEEALQKSELRFQELFNDAPVGYHEVNLKGNVTQVNRTELKMLGYDFEEMLGQPIWKFLDEEDKVRQAFLDKMGSIMPAGRAFERTYRRKNGTRLSVLSEDRILMDSDGKVIGMRSTIQDITERKRTEEEMAALQEQLRQSQKMEAVGQLAGGIAHDFNNLLTVIKGYGELSLLHLKEGDLLWGNIQEIEKATERAVNLTRQLLAFSRRQILDLKVLDLNTLLKDLDKMLRRIIGEDIELVILLDGDLGRAKIDPGQIEQVILNLAVNARDAMPSGGKLTIETANVVLDEEYAHAHVGVIPGHYVRLSVSDTGFGMSQEVKEKAFEPFFTTKDKGKGTGLGLSTVYGIVKQSGGNIWVYSEPEYGTTFKIYLPRVEEELDTPHGRDEIDSLPRGSETVLLVEDEPLVRDLAHRLLKQQGYNVFEAANGVQALRVAQEHAGETIHLLLTDVVMPQMGGKELAERIKPLRPDLKVLFTSGYTDDAIVHHGVLEPGTNFLQKPFSPATLAQKVREVLDK